MNFTSLLQDKRLTILLAGEIDHHSAKEIMKAITAKIDIYMPLCCVLDFGKVTFMDSSGIAVVIHTLRAMKELEGQLLLEINPCGVSAPGVHSLLEKGHEAVVVVIREGDGIGGFFNARHLRDAVAHGDAGAGGAEHADVIL